MPQISWMNSSQLKSPWNVKKISFRARMSECEERPLCGYGNLSEIVSILHKNYMKISMKISQIASIVPIFVEIFFFFFDKRDFWRSYRPLKAIFHQKIEIIWRFLSFDFMSRYFIGWVFFGQLWFVGFSPFTWSNAMYIFVCEANAYNSISFLTRTFLRHSNMLSAHLC